MGPKGKILALLGIMSWCWAVALLGDPVHEDAAVLHEAWPIRIRMLIWVVCGTGAILCAARPRWYAIGYSLLIVPIVIRAIGFAWSWIAWVIPGQPGGNPVAIAESAAWALVAAGAYHIMNWPDTKGDERARAR